MSQYDDVEFTQVMCVLHDAAKHGWDHHYAVNRTEIRLKIQRHMIRASRFVIYHTNENAPVCDLASRVAEAVITELTCDHRISSDAKSNTAIR